MRWHIPLLAAAAAAAAGCASADRPQSGPGAAKVGVPRAQVDTAVLLPPSGGGEAAPGPVQLPDRITLPASYRLVLLEGHFVLVRESDPQALVPAPASMRIISGEIARGELAYQPGLLPQELAAEVAANRESSARMDNALEDVMRRSRELSAQALELQAQSRRLAELLAAAQARVRELEAAGRAAQAPAAREPGAQADPGHN
jgi:hypothetical protein